MGYCQKSGANTPQHILEMANAINQALRGETYNLTTITFATGETSKTIAHALCGAGKVAALIPINAAAASAGGYMSSMDKGSMVLAAGGSGERKFVCVILGAK